MTGSMLRCLILLLAVNRLHASQVVLSYTEYFDYAIPGIIGHPSATWTSTFDPALQPSSPFESTPTSTNQDLVLSGIDVLGAPRFFAWQGNSINGVQFGTFTVGLQSYLVFPFLPLFPACSLPCSETALHVDQAVAFNSFSSLFAGTSDTFVAVPAPVPEPSALSLLLLGFFLLRCGCVGVLRSAVRCPAASDPHEHDRANMSEQTCRAH